MSGRKWSFFVRGLVLSLMLMGLVIVPQAQTPIFRIGVLDAIDGELAQGAQLAVDEINAAGGVVGADGTRFALQLVIQPTDDLEFAVANINQASVIAVIGPRDSATVLSNRDVLARLNVPILTTATDDTLITNDTSDLLLRLRAQETLLGRSLANYLISDLGAASMVTVQLDLESTVSVLGFSRAARQQGLAPSNEYILSETTTMDQIVGNISATFPQFVVAYGSPDLAAQLYNNLRSRGWPGRFVYDDAGSSVFRDAIAAPQLPGIVGVSTWSYTYGDIASETFTLAYVRDYGELPNEFSAAAYDAVYLLQEAIGQPGNLQTNLLAIRSFDSVQGELSPALLVPGETSSNVVVSELGNYGAPVAVARYEGIQRIELEGVQVVIRSTPTPAPTSTPAPTATPEGTYLTITRSAQNVRTGPGLNYDILGQLNQGDTAQLIGANIDFSWVAINFRGTIGWLSRDILDVTGSRNTVPLLAAPPTPTPPPATVTPLPPQIADIVVTNASPTRITIGVPFNVSATIANRGGVAAGTFAVAATFEPGGVYSSITLTSLGASSQVNVSFTGVLSGATGPQDVTIVADLNNQVNEGAGESNNSNYILRYIADAPLLTSAQATGTLSIAELGTTSLDGGSADIQWGGGGLVPLGSTELVVLNGFTTMDSVHRDAIANNANLLNAPINPVTTGMLIGVKTDGGTKHGVLQITNATAGSQVTFNYRMYDN